MDQVHIIRHKVLVEGVSRREVAQQLRLSRNTVRKYVEQDEPGALQRPRVQRRQPVLEQIRPRVELLLQDWSKRTTDKQRITARRVYQQLIAEGVSVGETSVRKLVRQWRRLRTEAFVPLVHRAGDEAQVDFFEVTLDLAGQRVKRWMFLLRLMYSGRDAAWLYDKCDQVAFLDGHVRAFAHLGGVPARCVYDNLSAAVRRVLFPGRLLTQRFMALSTHYLFEPCFARVGTGHDKGGVEGRGKGIRLQHLVPIPVGETLEQVCAELLERLDAQAQQRRDAQGQTVMQRFAQEQPLLRPLAARPFEPRVAVALRASRKSLVTYRAETYSLPSHWRLLDVMAYVGPTDIRFICRDETQLRRRVARHERHIRYSDYLVELSRKPQAVRQVAPELMAELGEPFGKLWTLMEQTHGGREAGRIVARVLAAVVEHGTKAVAAALTKALDGGAHHLLELAALRREALPADIAVPEPLAHYVIEAARAADFDVLLAQVHA